MLTVNIDDIQKNLTSYLHQVAAGESIIIIQSGKPIAEIKPVSPTSSKLRPYGLCLKGRRNKLQDRLYKPHSS
ncbi:type II toxin-antitoxin system Phd/YefM family antitoxin [Sphaerospermopsis torques-reginae]|uniref:Type II toxin-antitoxin system prevent-host-death family antitoxin n=1 Tax=Sphaerospermopsis torques-reginae ITEP-024 TaxID=984208 RepID=A0ABX8X4Q1_9CYAN|nr:type II toxin-antitoxin system prevent-host-death family antitoxin [Sphaerospermopsis torques-reginae]QYX33640.1 type II toxin-antitoxin system prevent-host-death family antitoxin [Sphaerospermopsis torques-reginae ITEP-024]